MSKTVAEKLKNNWIDFKKALNNLEKLFEYWNVDLTRYNDNWNILIPIIYVIYGNPKYFENERAMFAYMTRAIFFIYYRSGTTGKLQKLKNAINNNNLEITEGLLNGIAELTVSEAKIQEVLDTEKGKNVAEEALYFISRGWINKNFKYEQDHLHPYSKFDINNKPINVDSEDWYKWRLYRNRLANLHLLEGRSNGSKNDMRLVDYYNDMNTSQKEEFKKNALIPDRIKNAYIRP